MRVEFHIFHHAVPDPGIEKILAGIRQLKRSLKIMREDVAAEFQADQDAIAAETEVVQSAKTLLESLNQKLDDALAAGTPDEVIAAVRALKDGIVANKDGLAAAVAANTPAEPTA